MGRKIYTFGGWGGSATFHTVVEVYDIDSDTWSVTDPLPEKKAWMATAEVDGRIFVMGEPAVRRRGDTGGLKICTNMFFKVLDASAEWWSKAESYRFALGLKGNFCVRF